MLAPRTHPTGSNALAVIQSERLRMRAELMQLIAGARQTIARSRALLTEVDALLANEKLPLLQSTSRGGVMRRDDLFCKAPPTARSFFRDRRNKRSAGANP
jgi:ABC-type Fe3+/spermidine/putrescine transport system ATPase subunit